MDDISKNSIVSSNPTKLGLKGAIRLDRRLLYLQSLFIRVRRSCCLNQSAITGAEARPRSQISQNRLLVPLET
jgi:hypothetical protein